MVHKTRGGYAELADGPGGSQGGKGGGWCGRPKSFARRHPIGCVVAAIAIPVVVAFTILLVVLLSKGSISHRIEAAIDEMVANTPELAGLSAAIIYPNSEGEIQTEFFFRGEVEKGTGVLPDELTKYEIGSITKCFTALHLAEMVRDGECDWTDLAQRYYDLYTNGTVVIPGFVVNNTDGGNGTTIEEVSLLDMATYSSGLSRNGGNHTLFQPCGYTVDDMYAYLATDNGTGPFFAPGTQYLYSNLAYALLADVLRLIQGEPTILGAFGHLFDPDHLDLPNTDIVPAENFTDPHLAVGYDAEGERSTVCALTWPAFDGSGALYSTLEDMVSFVKFNLNITYNPHLTDLLPVFHARWWDNPSDDAGPTYTGLAWGMEPFPGPFPPDLPPEDERYMLFKAGGTPGFITYIAFVPSTSTGVVLLKNTKVDDGLGARMLDILNDP